MAPPATPSLPEPWGDFFRSRGVRSYLRPFEPGRLLCTGCSHLPLIGNGYRTGMRILVVEDEPKMAGLVKRGLEREGYAVDLTANGTDALWAGTENDYDAIVLDVMIPAPDGFEVCRQLRERGRWAPVLLLTAREGINDRVAGLDAGADDYLTKPFAFAELFARIRAITRREAVERPTVLRSGDLTMDPAKREVRRGEVRIELSPTEFSLLEQFLRHEGEVLTRSRILEHVWDFEIGRAHV